MKKLMMMVAGAVALGGVVASDAQTFWLKRSTAADQVRVEVRTEDGSWHNEFADLNTFFND